MKVALIAGGIILVVETCVAAYLAFVVWLLSVWMLDDSVAVRMTQSDWLLSALWRLAAGAAKFVITKPFM